jgi:hypothetical protein
VTTSRLLEIIEQLLHAEGASQFQNLLSEVNSHLSTLANQPNQPQHQTNFAEALQRLRAAWLQMQGGFEPAQIKRFEEIQATPFFVEDIPSDIDRRVAENPATLAVVQQYVGDLLSRRQQFLATLGELRDRLERLGITASGLEPGEAEVGFTIPRQLFEDNLDGLIGELREVRFIIRAFSEAATGSVEPIVVKQISTTDPLFFFGMSVTTIVMIGKAVHWVLDTWKKVEEIREVRARTRKLNIEGDAAIVEMFDLSIKKTIDAAVDAKVKELAPPTDGKDGRARELETHLNYALHSLFARIERGMTVEIRFLPPPAPADSAAVASPPDEAAPFTQLSEISPQLIFPRPAVEPVLALPRAQGASAT